jgi:signal transduction histidine kinase
MELSQTTLSRESDTTGNQQDTSLEALTNGQKLLIIFGIARRLATERDLETILDQLLFTLIETFEAADAGVLRLYDAKTDRLIVTAAQGYRLEALYEIDLVPGESTSGQAFKAGSAILYTNPMSVVAARGTLTPEHREMFAQATAGFPPAQSIISLLLSTEKKIGTLTLVNRRQPGSFASADLSFWEAVADVIALAIENALLMQELQEIHAFSEANRLKAELISTLAHEMRTPLTSIKGYSTALLLDEARFAPETEREFLEIIDEECDTLQDLIHDLLESSIIDAGLLKIEPQPIRLPRLTVDVVDDIARRTDIHHFLLDFPEDFPIVDADPRRIAQVLRNLVDNAVKYSPAGGLIVVHGEAHEDEVVISVADQGVGIAPEDLNRLFERFFRVKSGMGRHVVGSGLGLPISHTIVESHGGRIWAESQVKMGTTLYFTLPLHGPSRQPTQ